MEVYNASIIGLALLCLVPIILGAIVGPLKGKLGLPGGPIAAGDEASFLFRADRAQGNSVESLPFFLAPAILAIIVGVAPLFLAVAVWAYLVLRVLYVLVYLRGGSLARGGSLRTILHVLGSLTAIAVVGAVVLKLVL
jgi:uncharacterized MAPEG superfamily protein